MRAHALILFCVALQLLPLWSVGPLPMSDLPQHAAQVATWSALSHPGYPFAQLFTLNWLTPYLLGYCATRLLTSLFSIGVAIKLVISLALIGLPLATTRLLRATGGDPRWAILMVPFGFTMSFYWGFLNFLVATPVGILFIARAFRYAQSPTKRSAVWLALFACFLYLCHILVLLFGCAVAGLLILQIQGTDLRRAMRNLWPLLVPIPLVVGWFFITHHREGIGQQQSDWHWEMARLVQFPSEICGLSGGLDKAQAVCAVGLCSLPFLMGAKVHWRRLLPASLVVLIFLVAPFYAFGTSCIYPRFAIFFVPLFLSALTVGSANRLQRIAPWLGATLVLGSMLTLTVRFVAFDEEARDFQPILAKMEPGRTALSMIYLPMSSAIKAPVFTHFSQWYQAEKGGLVDPSFAVAYPQLVRYRDGIKSPPLNWLPWQFRSALNGHYDYYIVRAPIDVGPDVLRDLPVVLIANQGVWWLYQRVPGH